jgi:RimJ/RimL family protein N-acetyltransferase
VSAASATTASARAARRPARPGTTKTARTPARRAAARTARPQGLSLLIETERLTLRRLREDDADGLVELFNDPQVRRFIAVKQPYGRADALGRIAADACEWDELGHRILAVEERATGRFAGRVLLYDWPQFGETEIGWTLVARARGRGYATEAARTFTEWGFANLDVPYLISLINPDNEPSRRVAERLGMTVLREEELEGEPHLVYALRR